MIIYTGEDGKVHIHGWGQNAGRQADGMLDDCHRKGRDTPHVLYLQSDDDITKLRALKTTGMFRDEQ